MARTDFSNTAVLPPLTELGTTSNQPGTNPTKIAPELHKVIFATIGGLSPGGQACGSQLWSGTQHELGFQYLIGENEDIYDHDEYVVDRSSVCHQHASNLSASRILEQVLRQLRSTPPQEDDPVKHEFESLYSELAREYGDAATRESRNRQLQRWCRLGYDGASLLVARIEHEDNDSTLEWASAVLAELSSEAISPILDSLEMTSSKNAAWCLLTALSHSPEGQDEACPTCNRIQSAIQFHLGSEDPVLREAAAKATRALPKGLARELLHGALQAEIIESVRDTIVDEMTDLGFRS